jgi:DNA mismatch repair ATPase MutS
MNLVRDLTTEMAHIIRHSGKGTAPVDGMALLAACIRHFNSGSTRVLFALHFHEIFTPEIIDFDILTKIQAFKMAVHTESSGNEMVSMYNTPLYKLQLGLCDNSGGMRCAKSAGMNSEVLERASDIKTCILSKTAIPQRRRQTILNNSFNSELLKRFLSVSHWKDVNEIDLATLLSFVQESILKF